VVAPGDQDSMLIEVMTKETIPANDCQKVMCNIIVQDVINIILVSEEN